MIRYVTITVGEHPYRGDRHTATISVDFADGKRVPDADLLNIVSDSVFDTVAKAALRKQAPKLGIE